MAILQLNTSAARPSVFKAGHAHLPLHYITLLDIVIHWSQLHWNWLHQQCAQGRARALAAVCGLAKPVWRQSPHCTMANPKCNTHCTICNCHKIIATTDCNFVLRSFMWTLQLVCFCVPGRMSVRACVWYVRLCCHNHYFKNTNIIVIHLCYSVSWNPGTL